MERSSDLYVIELNDRSRQKLEIWLILFIVSICALTIVMVVLIPVVSSVNK